MGAIAVSNAAFVVSAVYFDKCAQAMTLVHLVPCVKVPSRQSCIHILLRRLSLDVLQDERTASVATLLYCFNAAAVFCSAAYTESLFLALTFAGLWYLSRKPWLATALLTFASSARSNGVLSAWFLCHTGLRKLLRMWPHDKARPRPCVSLEPQSRPASDWPLW